MTERAEPVPVGVLLPTREARVSGRDDPEPLLELAEEAERLGFDSVWAGDSPFARPRLDPLSILSAVAARTEHVGLGTAVLLGALRPPLLTAHALASVDQIAGGRLVVGLGAGFPYPATQAEFEAAGVPFRERIGRLMETVAIWRLLWSESGSGPSGASHNGRYWQFADVELSPPPSQPGGPRLWLAGSSPRALERTGTSFDGWLPYPSTAEQYAQQLAAVEQAARDAGREPSEVRPALYATIALDDEPTCAQAQLAEYVEGYYQLPLEVLSQVQAVFAGTPSDCVAWLSDYLAAGTREIVLRFATLESPVAMLGQASADVVPALRQLGRPHDE
jgi:alkanesulfonate monooxygenase SsuD/methylene tetrahydromethanopterin reductase-like flavin-dependent oxidoreductase (luciferase family)